MANTQVQLDGRTLEGGGQIVRIAIGLSALTGIPVRITNIRGNRSDGGGLKTQHLASVDWLSQACNGKTRGATLKSTTLDFTPGSLKSGSPAYRLVKGRNDLNSFWECKLDIRTAGSTGLGLQAILPFIIFEPPRNEDGTLSNLPTQLTLSGGTNASNSPSYEYIAHVLLPTLHNIGLPKITSGLYERNVGNERGTFTLYIPARQQLDLPAFSLHPGTSTSKPQPPERFAVTFIAPDGSHTHLIDMLLPELKKYFGKSYSAADKNITYNFDYSLQGKRYYLLLVATVPSSSDDPTTPKTYKLGRDFMYTSKHAARRVAGDMSKRVCQELHAEWDSGAYVDEYMRDQLVVYQALAQGDCRVYGGRTGHGEPRPASLHARTAEWVCEQMDNAD